MWKLWCVERIFMTLDIYTMLNLIICVSDLYPAKVKLANFQFYKSQWFNVEYFKLSIIEKLAGIFTTRINMVGIHVCV